MMPARDAFIFGTRREVFEEHAVAEELKLVARGVEFLNCDI